MNHEKIEQNEQLPKFEDYDLVLEKNLDQDIKN